MTLRLLPVGFSFYLLRTMQKFTLTSVVFVKGRRRYVVKEDGAEASTWLHHSCQIKVVLKPRDPPKLHSLGCHILPMLDQYGEYDHQDQ